MKFLIVSVVLAMLPAMALRGQETVKVPAEVGRFLEKGWVVDALEAEDLNADGRGDFVLVVSDAVKKDAGYEEGGGARSVMLLARDAKGELQLAGRNDSVAYAGTAAGRSATRSRA